jgi:hypothetical protein
MVSLDACAAGSSEARHAAGGGGVSQLFLGLWHGIIAPATLLIELINRLAPGILPWSARFYESRDTLAEYDVGFYLGLTSSPILIWTRWPGRRSD